MAPFLIQAEHDGSLGVFTNQPHVAIPGHGRTQKKAVDEESCSNDILLESGSEGLVVFGG